VLIKAGGVSLADGSVRGWRPYEDLNLGFRLELLFSLELADSPVEKSTEGERRPGPLDDRDVFAKSQYHASALVVFFTAITRGKWNAVNDVFLKSVKMDRSLSNN